MSILDQVLDRYPSQARDGKYQYIIPSLDGHPSTGLNVRLLTT